MLLSWGDSTFPKAETSVDVSVDCPRCKIRDSEIKEDSGPMKQGNEMTFSNPVAE